MLRASAALIVSLCSFGALAGEVTIDARDLKGAPVVDVVVYAVPASGAAPRAAEQPHATIDQIDKQFMPRVSVMQAGAEVTFPNSDNIRHSVYSFSPAKVFTTKLYAGKHADPITFDKSGVIVLGCNIHDDMLAWAVVVDTPWFAKTSAAGVAELKGLTAGAYRISAWYPGMDEPVTQQVDVAAQGAARQAFKIDTSASPLKPAP